MQPQITPAPALSAAQTAWVIASRDTELARWQELYEAAVPRPDVEAGE